MTATGLLGIAAALYFIDPAATRVLPPCPFHWATGLYCPGCGSLRSLHQLLNGSLAGALRFNPLLVLSLPGILLLLLKPRWSSRPWVAWTALAVLVTYGIVRNLPWAPFTWLAPG